LRLPAYLVSCPSLPFSPFFFFSTRRRHTSSTRDWSSDVCSSDLPSPPFSGSEAGYSLHTVLLWPQYLPLLPFPLMPVQKPAPHEIGRASCRERGGIAAVGG